MANGKTWWCGYLPAATHRTLLSKYLQSQAARVICLDRTCTHTSTHTLSPLIRVTDLIASPKVINRIYVKKKTIKKPQQFSQLYKVRSCNNKFFLYPFRNSPGPQVVEVLECSSGSFCMCVSISMRRRVGRLGWNSCSFTAASCTLLKCG